MFELFESSGRTDLEEILSDIHQQHVDGNVVDFQQFSQTVHRSNKTINILLHHIIGERLRTKLEMDSESFYYKTGELGLLKEAKFRDAMIHSMPVDAIFMYFGKVSREKNAVTDVKELYKTEGRRDRKRIKKRVMERTNLPYYLRLLREQELTTQDINYLLTCDWYITKGCWIASGDAKEVDAKTSELLTWKQLIVDAQDTSLLNELQYNTPQYKTDSEGLTAHHTLTVLEHLSPSYTKQAWYLFRGLLTPPSVKRENANLKFELIRQRALYRQETIDLAVARQDEAIGRAVEAETNAAEQQRLRETAEEARDVAVVAQGEAEQARSELERIYKRFTHDIGNSMNMLAIQANRLYQAAERARSIEDLTEAQVFNEKQAEALRSLSELSKINTSVANASLLLLDRNYKKIRSESTMMDLREMFSQFLPLTCKIENDVLTDYGHDLDYNPQKLLHPKVEFEKGDYRTLMNESLFYSFGFNIFTNSYKATVDCEKRSIEIYGSDLGDSIELRFKDNGYGIDKETRQTLLTPDQKVVSSEGTGLGFFTIREFISYYKGTYDINTQQGDNSYTELVVTLPKEQVEIQRKSIRKTFGGPRR